MAYRLAQATGLPQTRIGEIVRGKRSITTDTALRFSKALGVDDPFWINIQTDYDIEVERDLHADELAKVTFLRLTTYPSLSPRLHQGSLGMRIGIRCSGITRR